MVGSPGSLAGALIPITLTVLAETVWVWDVVMILAFVPMGWTLLTGRPTSRPAAPAVRAEENAR